MLEPIQKIVIVGGGVAGWLSASVLCKLRREHFPQLEIHIIDSSLMSPIGVGEATTTTTVNMLMWLGIDENDWLKTCDGTFKFGIKFNDWCYKKESYWHVFETPKQLGGTALPLHWLAQTGAKAATRFAYDCFISPYLAEANCAPRAIDAAAFSSHIGYGYHINVAKHVAYLKKRCLPEVNWIDDIVLEATRNSKGDIESVTTQSGQKISGQLFLDCTGFRALLINQCLQEPFETFKDVLLCDRALAVALPPRDPADSIKPYTGSTAMQAGWCWDIPLRKHTSIGYVHSSTHISPEAAYLELAQHLGRPLEALDVRTIQMRTGQSRRVWVNNCLSIGLASGFIEPLESTGNSFVETIAAKLYEVLGQHIGQSIPSSIIDAFNQFAHHAYDEVKDFIILHYYLTTRSDTSFWKSARQDIVVPQTILEKLKFLNEGMPQRDLKAMGLPWFDHIFPQFSYLCILAGMHALPNIKLEATSYDEDQNLAKCIQQLKQHAKDLIAILPTHRDFLKAHS